MNANAAAPKEESKELAAVKAELALANMEIKAIKLREQTYVEQGKLDEMTPWFDMSDNERAQAMDYFGPEMRNRNGRAIYPVEGCNSVADIRALIASLRS
jgi:hypothetical protein